MKLVFDIETMPSFFSVVFISYTDDKTFVYEISERKNDLQAIKDVLKKTKYLIGFNNIHFDNIILNYIVTNNITNNQEIYNLSQIVINQDVNYDDFAPYKKYQYFKNIKSVDLFLYWSKMLRISKKMSLKYFAVNLDEEVLEMPIHHTQKILTDEEKDLILKYNENDVKVTKKLAQRLKEEINLRIQIEKEYSLNCISWDGAKIASEMLLKEYCKYTEKDVNEVKRQRYTKPTNIKLGDILPDINFKHSQLKKIYEHIRNSCNTYSNEFVFKNCDDSFIKISIGVGGLHSVNKNQKFYSTDKKIIKTADIASMYPTNLINYKLLNPVLLEIYKQVKNERIVAKKTGNKVKDVFFKLILNSTSGLIDSSMSWMYSPENALSLRLTGQLQLLKLMEMFYYNNIPTISLNTDGTESIVDVNNISTYNDILKEHTQIFNVDWETDVYSKVYMVSVNDYLAITEKGKVKQKGMFVSNKTLDGSNEFLIIPIALENYLVNNISIEKTIKQHKNIYDFCAAKKISKDYKLFYKGKVAQQLNRFFVSTRKEGAYLYKQKNSKNTMENVLKDTPIYLLNEKTDKLANEFPINYDYYIGKTQDIIDIFYPKQLSLF